MKALRILVDVTRLLAWASIVAAGVIFVLYAPGVARRYVEGPSAAAAVDNAAAASGGAAATFPVPDFAAVALTAASLVVAALAIVLAIAGVVGYYNILKAAETKAAEVAARKAAEVAGPVGARSGEAAAAVSPEEVDIGDAVAAAQDKGGQDAGRN